MDEQRIREALEEAAQQAANDLAHSVSSVIRTQRVRALVQDRLNEEAMGGQAIVKEVKPGGYDITISYPRVMR